MLIRLGVTKCTYCIYILQNILLNKKKKKIVTTRQKTSGTIRLRPTGQTGTTTTTTMVRTVLAVVAAAVWHAPLLPAGRGDDGRRTPRETCANRPWSAPPWPPPLIVDAPLGSDVALLCGYCDETTAAGDQARFWYTARRSVGARFALSPARVRTSRRFRGRVVFCLFFVVKRLRRVGGRQPLSAVNVSAEFQYLAGFTAIAGTTKVGFFFLGASFLASLIFSRGAL